MPKLVPPGVSVAQINVKYPASSGKVLSNSVVTTHENGIAHLGHSGAYNVVIGYGHFMAHLSLLAQGEALVEKKVEEEMPKNGHSHDLANEVEAPA